MQYPRIERNNFQKILLLYFSIVFIFSFVIFSNSFAQGWIIPEELPQIEHTTAFVLEEQNIQAKIINQVADYEITQVFRNQENHQVEGVFYFPLPNGSQIRDFAYIVNGEKIKGELLEKDKARKIYQEIVRRQRDPALLEYLHQDLFRASIFPVPAGDKCEIELKFSQVLGQRDRLYEIDYPLFQKQYGRKVKRFAQDAKLTALYELQNEQGIQQIYSPTHNVDIIRKNQNQAVASFEGKIADINANRLTIYFKPGDDDVGISVLGYNESGEDGYYLLIASPQFNPDTKNEQPKDVLFVLDVSGSMAGEKIDQAKQALLYCLQNLKKKDRFNIIKFSTEPTFFAQNLQPVDKVNTAEDFIQDIEAKGGTNIHAALTEALQQNQDENRLFTIVFITDGLPTVGITDDKQILTDVLAQNKQNVRLFTFGIGYDVNTFLVDQLAGKTNAVADYIKPQENIEMVVSSFFKKISAPVLTDVALQWNDIDVNETYPQKLPDLFKGGEIVVLGRFQETGKGEVVFSGRRESELFRYAVDVDFSKSNDEYQFIPPLWGARKIGYLLDEIRLNGENKELVDEIIRLSKKYGIVTPYTSYLAQEDQPAIANHRVQPFMHPQRPVPMPHERMYKYQDKEGISGEAAVRASEQISSLKVATQIDVPSNYNSQFVAGRNFILEDNIWHETGMKKDLPEFSIQYGSDAYFNLLEVFPELIDIASLGEKIEFQFMGHIIQIGETGKKDISKQELRSKLKS